MCVTDECARGVGGGAARNWVSGNKTLKQRCYNEKCNDSVVSGVSY